MRGAASTAASLPSIREEPNSHECTEDCACKVPLDAGGHSDSVVEKRFRDPPFALNQTHDAEGKTGDRSDQSAPILGTRRTIYEVNPATSRPVDFTPCPEVPRDHSDEVLVTNSKSFSDEFPRVVEHGPDLKPGTVTVCNETYTTRVRVHSGPDARSTFGCIGLLDTGSPQTFIREDAWDKMKSIQAASLACESETQPRVWGGFGDHEPLRTTKYVRLSIQFLHGQVPSAKLAVWAYVVPRGTMEHSLLLGRDSWPRFKYSYRKLPRPHPSGRTLGELTLRHIDHNGARAYVVSSDCELPQYHLIYSGTAEVSLSTEPQQVSVDLVRKCGTPALEGHYLVELSPSAGVFTVHEHFVSSGKQSIPLAGCATISPGDVIGTANAPLLEVPLDDVERDFPLHQEEFVYPTVERKDGSDVKTPPSTLLERFDSQQRDAFLEMWERIPSHLHDICFDLQGPGWTPSVISALGDVLVQYQNRFSRSKTDLGHCTTLPFKIDIPKGTPPVASRPYRTSPAIAKQVDAILDSYLAAGLIEHSPSPWASPLVVVPKKDGSIRITVNYKRLNSLSIVGKWPLPRIDEVLDSLGKSTIFSTFDLMSGFFQNAIDPGSIELYCFHNTTRFVPVVAHATRTCRSP